MGVLPARRDLVESRNQTLKKFGYENETIVWLAGRTFSDIVYRDECLGSPT